MARSLKQEVVGEQVRMLRRRAGITLRGLAARSGFSPSFISELENGQVSPSINSMERLGRILGVGLAEFFAGTGGANGAQLIRALDRTQAQSLWSQARIEILAAGGSRHDLQPVLITLEPGGRSGKHPTAPGREEFMFVLEGELIVTVGPDEVMVRPGDALLVRPREVRRYENPGPAPARILVVSASLPAPKAPTTAGNAVPGRRSPRARALPTRRK